MNAAPLRRSLERLAADLVAGSIRRALRALLAATTGPPTVRDLGEILAPLARVQFAPQAVVRSRRTGGSRIDLTARYDGTIATRGVVPTREGSLHDVLNALVWASLPATKRAIHARQFAVMNAHVPRDATRLPNARPREADVLAMLDEGGLVFAVATAEARAALEGVLLRGDVESIAVGVRSLEADALVVGHAVLEHVAEERDGDPRAAAYVVVVDGTQDASVGQVDEAAGSPRLRALDDAMAERVRDPGEMLGPPPWPAVPVRALHAAIARWRGSGDVAKEGQSALIFGGESQPGAGRART